MHLARHSRVPVVSLSCCARRETSEDERRARKGGGGRGLREGGADKRRGGGDQEGKGRRVVAVSDRRRPIDQRATADDRHPNTIAKQGKPPPSCAAAVVVAVPGIIAAAAVDALLPVEGVDGAQQETRERANASKQCVSHHLCDVLGAHALRRAPRIFAAPALVRELRLAVPGQAHRLVRWMHLRGLRSLSCAHQRNTKTRVQSYMCRR